MSLHSGKKVGLKYPKYPAYSKHQPHPLERPGAPMFEKSGTTEHEVEQNTSLDRVEFGAEVKNPVRYKFGETPLGMDSKNIARCGQQGGHNDSTGKKPKPLNPLAIVELINYPKPNPIKTDPKNKNKKPKTQP